MHWCFRWKKETSPFRGEPFFVKRVPTLLMYNQDGSQTTGDRLKEDDLIDAAKIRDFLNQEP